MPCHSSPQQTNKNRGGYCRKPTYAREDESSIVHNNGLSAANDSMVQTLGTTRCRAVRWKGHVVIVVVNRGEERLDG